MTAAEQIVAARDQLNRTLAFFSRVDAKASVVLAVDTSMLAVLTAKLSSLNTLRWEWIPIALAFALLGASLWNVHQEAFPALEGGEESLLYFREVAKLTEANYIAKWMKTDETEHLRDLLGQVWRNSCILTKKFNHIRLAINFLMAAIVPWLVSVAWLWNATTAAK